MSESESSGESIVDDTDKDPDYICNENSYLSDTFDDADTAIDFVNFNDWDDVSIEPITKRKSKSEVWNFYGTLKKGNKIFSPTSKRYFCKPCFDNHKFKRLFFSINI